MEMVVAVGADEVKRRVIAALTQRAAQIAAEQALQTAAVAAISWVPIIGQIAVTVKVAGYVLTGVTVLKLICSLIEYLNKGQTGSLTEEQRRLLAEVEAKVKEDMKKKEDNDDEDGEKPEELHKAWRYLINYKNGRKGVTYKIWRRSGKTKDTKNEYYYEKDYTHGDVEVYKIVGSKGIHIGCISMEGGHLTKPPVKGRTVNL